MENKKFCEFIRNESDRLRLSYKCKITNNLCPYIEYETGRPIVSERYCTHGCNIKRKENAKLENKDKEIKKSLKQDLEKNDIIKTDEEKIKKNKKPVIENKKEIISKNQDLEPKQNQKQKPKQKRNTKRK